MEACKALLPSSPAMSLNKLSAKTAFGLAVQSVTASLLLTAAPTLSSLSSSNWHEPELRHYGKAGFRWKYFIAAIATCPVNTCGQRAGHEELPKTLASSVMCRLPWTYDHNTAQYSDVLKILVSTSGCIWWPRQHVYTRSSVDDAYAAHPAASRSFTLVTILQ